MSMDGSTMLFGMRLLWGRISGKSYPFLVQLNVTNRCNLRCSYCYGSYYGRPSEEMTFDQIREVIDRLHEAGTFRINLVGGEPLLRSDIGEIIAYIRGKKIHCAMTTNGTLVPNKMDAVRRLNLVCFSVDGRPENNDLSRGKGSYLRVLEGLEACRRRGIPVQLSAVITRMTADDVDFMVSLAREFGCRVGFSVLIGARAEGAGGIDGLIPSRGQMIRALKRIVELKRQGGPILFSAKSYQYALDWPDFDREIRFDSLLEGASAIRCQAGKCFCLIDYNGDVYPCPQLLEVFKPGNIFHDGVDVALKRSARHGCKACAIPCSNDFNLFFSLDPAVMTEHLLTYGRK